MKRHITATLASLLLGTAPALLATGPASAAGTCTFQPLQLTTTDINDPWPDSNDEIKLLYGSRVYRQNGFHVGSTLTSTPPPEQFTGEMQIQLIELDTGTWRNPDDLLGTITIGSNPGNNVRDFTESDAHYKLTYSVTC